MASTKDSANATSPDWSKFDFSRWSLSGLPIDGGSSTVASLMQKVIASPQWPKAFGATLPAIKTALVQHLTIQAQALQKQSADLDQTLASRATEAQAQIVALQENLRTAAAPIAAAADPTKFQLAAKAVDQKSQLGLPGMTVQLVDPKSPGTPVATGTTDANGNVLLSVSKKQADTLAKAGSGLTLNILNAQGKKVQTLNNVLTSRANQVETQVASLPASADTAASAELANRTNEQRTAVITSLNAKTDQLQAAFASRKLAIQTQVTEIQNTIAAIQSELKPPPASSGS